MATLYDVCKKSGVSTATVSRVLNGSEAVKEETRERVLQAIKELNYRPSYAARMLAGRKTVEVRTIKMTRDTAWGLQRSSKFHRSSQHLEKLRIEGREVAAKWLEGWRARGKDFDSYPDDARYA